nr:tyrosine-type recombinase/integrase [Magnetospirillum aberrantis]
MRKAAEAAKQETTKPEGTWGWLVQYWKSTPEWREHLQDSTKRDYQKVLNYLSSIDGVPLRAIDAARVVKIRNKAYDQHKRRFANYVLAVISRAWNIGAAAGKVPHGNPTNKEQKIRRPKGLPDKNRPWTAAEFSTVFSAMPHHLQVAMALALWAGWREGDVCRMKRSAYDGSSIQGRQGKTGDMVRLPCHSSLKAIIDAELKRQPRTPEAPLVITMRGGHFTESGFKASFFKVMRVLKAAGAVQPGLTFHGLRTTLATMIADAGGDTRDIAAALGHATEAMAAHYARHAEKRRRAARAIEMIDPGKGGEK